MCGRSPRTVSLEVHDIPLVAGGGANIGIDMVGLSSTGVYVGGVSRGSSAEGKVQAGDQILEINERKIGMSPSHVAYQIRNFCVCFS